MPKRDVYHDQVRNALIKEGWIITHDPLTIQVGKRYVHIDLGAESVIAAEKANLKIAVEIKSFVGKSDVDDLEKAVGQYVVYRTHLKNSDPDRKLYLAVPSEAYTKLFEEPIGEAVVQTENLCLLIFKEGEEQILKWIN
jgi:hypothetical protein